MIKQYKRKPIKVEAIQWTGDNFEEVKVFLEKYIDIAKIKVGEIRGSIYYKALNSNDLVVVLSKSFLMTTDCLFVSDFLKTEIEISTIPEELFLSTYEEVEAKEEKSIKIGDFVKCRFLTQEVGEVVEIREVKTNEHNKLFFTKENQDKTFNKIYVGRVEGDKYCKNFYDPIPIN